MGVLELHLDLLPWLSWEACKNDRKRKSHKKQEWCEDFTEEADILGSRSMKPKNLSLALRGSLVQAFSCFFAGHCFHHLYFSTSNSVATTTLQIVSVAHISRLLILAGSAIYHFFRLIGYHMFSNWQNFTLSWKETEKICCCFSAAALSLSKTHSWAKLLDTQISQFNSSFKQDIVLQSRINNQINLKLTANCTATGRCIFRCLGKFLTCEFWPMSHGPCV